jgi:hypothetical protein
MNAMRKKLEGIYGGGGSKDESWKEKVTVEVPKGNQEGFNNAKKLL